MTKFSAILATGRISNLPTVWCNVLVAFLLSLTSQQAPLPSLLAFAPLFLIACLAASLLYVGGCFLGDAVDVEFDKTHKPNRPIPSGILSRSAIYTSATFLLTAGLTLPLTYVWLSTNALNFGYALTLTAVIVAYSLWHKLSPSLGLPLIGACRFFLILFAASLTTSHLLYIQGPWHSDIPPYAWSFALIVGLYTICFASVARTESSPNPISWRKMLIVTMLLLPLFMFFPYLYFILEQETPLSSISTILPLPALTALLIYWAWMITAFRQINTNKGKFVSMSLAGFCLLDACFAAAFGWQWLLICLVLFALSLFLQKWAPAT